MLSLNDAWGGPIKGLENTPVPMIVPRNLNLIFLKL